jgi:biotin carboxyl carrier protein
MEADKEQKKHSSKTSVEDALSVVRIKSWVALGTLLLLTGGVVVWLFFGVLPIQEEVSGVIVRTHKIVNIYAPAGGKVLDFTLKENDEIISGQVVARIELPELTEKINALIDNGADETEIEDMRNELISQSQIISYTGGRVMETDIHAGDIVSQGQIVIVVAEKSDDAQAHECLMYVASDRIKNISRGQKANVFPAGINKDEYGNMMGVVVDVGEYPVTRKYLYEVLDSESLAESFIKNNAAYYEVVINLTPSENNVTGYEWSTSYGPGRKFGDLTLCDAVIIKDKARPFDLFFGDVFE